MAGNIQVNNSNSEQKLSLQRQINTKESQKSDWEEKRAAQAYKIQRYEQVLNNLINEEADFVVRKRNFGNIEPNGQEWNGTVGKQFYEQKDYILDHLGRLAANISAKIQIIEGEKAAAEQQSNFMNDEINSIQTSIGNLKYSLNRL